MCRGAVFVGINIREHVAVVDVRHDGDVLAALQGIAEVVGAMAKVTCYAAWRFLPRPDLTPCCCPVCHLGFQRPVWVADLGCHAARRGDHRVCLC